MRDYKDIKAYQLADSLVIEVYRATKRFPKEEMYGLVSQLRRAVVSVPSNIAEGASRQHKRNYLQFLYISRGSLAEVEYLVHLTDRLEYLTKGEVETINRLREDTAKTICGLIEAVERETR